jgi:C-terminal processing protease CtpA/Prc
MEPTKSVKKRFRYDRSGLSLIASGPQLQDITIFAVTPNTPADEVDLQKGDIIRTMNGIPGGFLSLQGAINRLKRRAGKRIKLRVERNEEIIKVKFHLRDLI